MKKITNQQLSEIHNEVNKYVENTVSIHHPRKRKDKESSTYRKLIFEKADDLTDTLETNKKYSFVRCLKRNMGTNKYPDYRPFICVEDVTFIKETEHYYVTSEGKYLKNTILCVVVDD